MLVSPFRVIFYPQSLGKWSNLTWVSCLSWRGVKKTPVFRLFGHVCGTSSGIHFPCGLKGFPRLHFRWLRQLLQVSQTIETKGIFRAHWVTWAKTTDFERRGSWILPSDGHRFWTIGTNILPGPVSIPGTQMGQMTRPFLLEFKGLVLEGFFGAQK